jgi:short-subunit dehydrogenase
MIQDKVIIITGASSGIGRATAIALAREKARLVLVARRENLLQELVSEIQGGMLMALDLRQKDHVENMIRRTKEEFGRIDVLINNAGFGFYGSVEKTPHNIVREIFDVNFEAPLLASQLVIPIMRAQRGGHIINVSSVVGKRGLPLSGIYCATKFALQGISESLRVEVKDAGIDVSIISPAATVSEFGDSVRYGDVTKKFKAAGRVQTAEEVAESIVQCIRNPKAEVYPNRSSRVLVWANAIAPSLVDRIMVRLLRDRLGARASNNP